MVEVSGRGNRGGEMVPTNRMTVLVIKPDTMVTTRSLERYRSYQRQYARNRRARERAARKVRR